jgi:hypothetical protein
MSDPNAGAIVAAGDVQSAGSSAIVAVGELKTHLPGAEELLAIKKLATQTKAIGIILPPPDIRAIIDKTAQFVAKHGGAPERERAGRDRRRDGPAARLMQAPCRPRRRRIREAYPGE